MHESGLDVDDTMRKKLFWYRSIGAVFVFLGPLHISCGRPCRNDPIITGFIGRRFHALINFRELNMHAGFKQNPVFFVFATTFDNPNSPIIRICK